MSASGQKLSSNQQTDSRELADMVRKTFEEVKQFASEVNQEIDGVHTEIKRLKRHLLILKKGMKK